jgi:hypothetical protein
MSMPKRERMSVEQDHHKQAFEVYRSLGRTRTLDQVARDLGVSLGAVKLWSSRFGWRQRLMEQEQNDSHRQAERLPEPNTDDNQRNRRLTKMALLKVARDIAEGKIKSTLSDLPRLIELDRLLSEEAGPPGSERGFRDLKEVQEYIASLDDDTLDRAARAVRAELEDHGDNRPARSSSSPPAHRQTT